MEQILQNAFISGVERVAAWSDLLDDINVFPIADGDTGRNLIASLTPLRQLNGNIDDTIQKLLMSARGNSGNIATRFFSGLLTANSLHILPEAAKRGRDAAWEAVNDPMPGTMLSVFDALVEFVEKERVQNDEDYVTRITEHLEKSVQSTPDQLPMLKLAGVVDSGALGMYVFLEGFFHGLINQTEKCIPITTRFKGLLQINSDFKESAEDGYCIDVVIQVGHDAESKMKSLAGLGESTVIIPHKDYLKLHLHTNDPTGVRKKIQEVGNIINWQDDDLADQVLKFKSAKNEGSLHIMTDAAGSLTREDARNLGLTLLDSYIITEDKSLPETLFAPEDVYKRLASNQKVSTSQASTFERHQTYQRVMEQHNQVLYLCVGSAFTGNYETAQLWKKQHDSKNGFLVLDTGAASGRLGIIALATARFAKTAGSASDVIEFAKRAIENAEEYVFLDRLKYLAAGGRLSKSGAFFGDMLKMKPIVSPLSEGAKKVGIAKNREAQMIFAFKKLKESIKPENKTLILLEYSDNRQLVEQSIKKEVAKHYPVAEIIVQPLSLTSGVHMGPGTWALAFLPEIY